MPVGRQARPAGPGSLAGGSERESRVWRTMTVARYLAFLRGINVGGKNKLPMEELRAMFVAAGCDDVQTYIQSGNVIFGAAPDVVSTVPGVITARIAADFRYRVPVIVRTAAELAGVLERNPFVPTGAAAEALHVMFLAAHPAADRVARLDPRRSPPDAFAVRGQEVYLHLPNGMARTKLTNAYIDTTLDTTSTARNWRTVSTLRTLLGA